MKLSQGVPEWNLFSLIDMNLTDSQYFRNPSLKKLIKSFQGPPESCGFLQEKQCRGKALFFFLLY